VVDQDLAVEVVRRDPILVVVLVLGQKVVTDIAEVAHEQEVVQGVDRGQDPIRGRANDVTLEVHQGAVDQVAVGREVEMIRKFLIRLLIGQISVMTLSSDQNIEM